MAANVKNQKKRKVSFLVVIAIVLYIFAAAFLISGFLKLTDYLSGSLNQFGMLAGAGYDDDFVVDIFLDFNGIDGVISTFIDAFIFFVWGSVLLVIAGIARRKKKAEERLIQEGYDKAKMEQAQIQQQRVIEERERVYCAYCDSELSVNDRKCPHCGANKKIKK